MRLLALFLAAACAAPVHHSGPVAFSCSGEKQEVCILNQASELVAVNTSDRTVAIELRVQHIENVELSYRYPFVEFLAPNSSRSLLSYKHRRAKGAYAFDYDWNWRVAN